MKNDQNQTELIIDLQERGYDQDFILQNEGILCVQQNELFPPEEFEIVETHRFEGKFRRDDFIIYAISLTHCDVKGILMTPVSTYTKGVSIHLWSKLATNIKNTVKEVRNNAFSELAFA
jgi:hypothetical protein